MDDFLARKFPGLEPGRKPSLGSVNGFGATLVGQRDHDPETGTYVTTQCVSLLFIPVFAIGAYRVAAAPGGGWYCLGKVPLSKFAKRWNFILVLGILAAIGGIWWTTYTKSPEYAAARKLQDADRAAEAGQGGRAARLCREVMDGKTTKAEEAKQKLAGLIENPPGPPSEATEVYKVAVDLHRENRCPVRDLFARGKTLAERYVENDPAAALGLLEMISPFAPDQEAELALRRELLEKMHARDPNNIETVSRLAAVYEAKGDLNRCEQLLAPFEAQLADRDGAAILGRIYSTRGEYDRAYALLRPYVNTRLPAFLKAQQNLTTQMKAAQDRVLDSLKSGNAPGFDYKRHKLLGKDRQSDMIEEYIGIQLKNDASLRAARERLMAERGVVATVLDLGLAQSQRAQKMPDPAARKAELEAAEKTFLSIRTVAGESDEYRLSLGQVYYWLGRATDGRKMFEELLTSRNRTADAVIQVAMRLREIGDFSESRNLLEEAYAKEKDLSTKQTVARNRALLMNDLDDEILWLSRSNPNEPSVEASLASSRGHKAQQDGKDEEAANHFRRAIEIFDKMPENASTLNNSALVYFSLYRVTQDRAHFTTGMDRLDRAIALLATNSILISNAAGTVLDGAARDVVGSDIDFKALKQEGGLEMLSYLYRTPAERTAILARLIQHPGSVKARAYAEKLMTLSPKRTDGYSLLVSIFGRTRNLEGLRAVLARLEKADLDLADTNREYREFLSGESDAKRLGDFRKAVDRATERLAAVRDRKDRTFAVAASIFVQTKLSAWRVGEKADSAELLKLAEEANAASPSEGTEATLLSAIYFRIHSTMIDRDPAYARIAEKTKRSFGSVLVGYLLADDAFQPELAANSDVKRLVGLIVEEFRRDPDAITPTGWALVRTVSPQDAPEMAVKIQGNERLKVRAAVEHLMSPDSVSQALSDYWMLQLEGKEAAAKKVFADLAKRGIPVP